MAEIELTGIRSRDSDRPTIDSSHEGLLSADHQDGGVANGNGHLHPESEAFLGRPIEKPPSVSVFRKPRRKWWILVLVIFIVAILIVAIFLGVFFVVSYRKEASPKNGVNSTTVNRHSVSSPPPEVVIKPLPDLHIHQFQSFRDSGSSRIFQATFSNGTVLKTFGHKGINGAFHSLYSISIGDAKGSDLTRIHFKGQNNFASVMLPKGAIVSYDWNHGYKNLECKIFSVPSNPANSNTVPVSHIVTLPLGEYSDVFARISKGLMKPHVQYRTNVSKLECNSRLPLLVTKCGSQYTYQGAFIHATLTPEDGPSVTMDALPWPATQDNCEGNNTAVPNYFLPLPVNTNISREQMEETFCSTGTTVFENLCLSIEGSDDSLDLDICEDLASNVKDKKSELYEHIYGSCFKIFHSIRLTCVALKYSSSADVSTSEFHVTPQEIYQSLCRNTSSTRDILTGPRLYVDVIAYCPSVHPISSFRQLIHINQTNISKFDKMMHINCASSPEVTMYVLGHKYIGPSSSSSQLDRLDHLLNVCATCAHSTVMEVKVVKDDTCCSNNCTRSDLCESGPHHPHQEMFEFADKSDVYCHQFLASYVNNMHSQVEQRCIKGCNMHLSLDFKLYSSDKSQMFYHQSLTCEESESLSCRRTFGR